MCFILYEYRGACHDEILTSVADGVSVGAGAGAYDRMSVDVGAEQGSRIPDSGDVVSVVTSGESDVRVAPV